MIWQRMQSKRQWRLCGGMGRMRPSTNRPFYDTDGDYVGASFTQLS